MVIHNIWILPSCTYSAIAAGFVAEYAAGLYGNIGPFRLAVLLSAIVFFIAKTTWTENRDTQGDKTVLGLFPIAWEKYGTILELC